MERSERDEKREKRPQNSKKEELPELNDPIKETDLLESAEDDTSEYILLRMPVFNHFLMFSQAFFDHLSIACCGCFMPRTER